jgi:hypothetical protein
MRPLSPRGFAWFSGAAPMLLIAAGLAAGAADFARWDNLELFLPSLLFAHRRILHGELPLWNPFQNLGEPIHAMGVAGVLYPPYSIATGLVGLVGGDPRAVMSVIVILHAGFAALGLHLLCRSFGVRPLFATVAAVSGAMCGYGLDVGAAWIPVMPNLAWGAWSLWGVKSVIDDPSPRRGLLVTAVSVAMPFHVGHAQTAFYNLIISGAFAIGWAALQRRTRVRTAWWAVAIAAAVLFAMPSVLPTAAILPDTEREQSFSRELFGERGMRPRGLLGLVLPVYGGEIGYLDNASLAPAHTGAWVIPAILLALLPVGAVPRARVPEVGKRRREARRIPAAPPADPGTPERRPLALVTGLALVIVVLSLGGHTPLYGWTYGIPLWSSFRWPFRLFLHAVPLLVTAGALALEILAGRRYGSVRRVAPIACAGLAVLMWFLFPGPGTVAAIVTGILGLATVVCLGWLDRPAGRASLMLTAMLAAGALFLFTHPGGRYKSYPDERPGSLDVKALGVTPDFRVLPLSPSNPPGASLQDLGLFHSATINHYASLTGQRFAMTSMRLRNVLPTEDNGLLPRSMAPLFLASHLMRSFNGRYALVARDDREMNEALLRVGGYAPIGETAHTRVYANADALPRMFFATEVRLFSPEALIRGLVRNQSAATCAFVEDAATEGPLPAARVESSRWNDEQVTGRLSAPAGGFLVVSMNASPDWIARVDGVRRPVQVTNGTLIGIEVPSGARKVELSYAPSSLRHGAWLALAGVVLLAGAMVGSGRVRRG